MNESGAGKGSVEIRMASFAVLERERHREMTGAAEFAFEHIFHPEMPGTFFLDIENVRMAVGAVEPLRMLGMGKNRFCSDQTPFRFKPQGPVKGDGFVCSVQKACLGLDEVFPERFDPVDTVTVSRFRQVFQLRKTAVRGIELSRMAESARGFAHAEGDAIVMAGAAILALPDLRFRDLRHVRFQRETEFEMANPAGVVPPVDPMRKSHRRMGAL